MLVLASASPRRLELLARAGVRVRVVPATLEEDVRDDEAPGELVQRLADEKARTVAERMSATPEDARTENLVLGADTVVTRGGEILGKPSDAEDARRMLALLSGHTHEVLTGWALWRASSAAPAATVAIARGVTTTEVHVRTLTANEITGYLKTREWTDKAGAYAIQGLFGAFISRIRGSYASVVGLPVCEVVAALRNAGGFDEDPWPHSTVPGRV